MRPDAPSPSVLLCVSIVGVGEHNPILIFEFQISAVFLQLLDGNSITCDNYTCRKQFDDANEYLMHASYCQPLYLCETCKQEYSTRKGHMDHVCPGKLVRFLRSFEQGQVVKVRYFVCLSCRLPMTNCGV